MTKASDNQFPSVLMVNTSNASVGTPSPWNAQRLFFDADGSLKRIDSADSVTAVEGGGSITFGGVSSTDTVSVASNFAVSDQGGGEARLDVFFPAGGGSGLSTGSSFPGGPSTGDRYRRSDIDYLVFFYDGTRWVSEQIFKVESAIHSLDGGGTDYHGALYYDGLDLWFIDIQAHMRASTNDGSNYHTITAQNNSNGSTWANIGSVNSSGISAATYDTVTATIGSAIASANLNGFRFSVAETGNPSNLYAGVQVRYRLIAT